MGATGQDLIWTRDLRADRQAPAEARGFLRSALVHRSPQERIDLVALLASEVVSNAVVHGSKGRDARIRLEAKTRGDRLRVEVSDDGPGFDPQDALTKPGFGLRLIRDLSARWGVDRESSGATVWFEV
jgi:anti-sigma regulatory factor (Ser/Thr protein kinase)